MVDVVAGTTSANRNLSLASAPLRLSIVRVDGEVEVSFFGHVGITYHLLRGSDLGNLGEVETILGAGERVRRNSITTGDTVRFWNAWQ